MRNPIVASIFVLSALALTACTPKLTKATLESGLTSAYDKQGIKLKSVTCPGDRELKADDKFDCQGELEGGDKATIKVHQKDAKGSLAFDIVGVVLTEEHISAFLTKQHASKVDAKCPKKMAILVKGQTFVCDVTMGADKGKVTIKGTTDDQASFQTEFAGKPAEVAVAGDEEKPIEADTAQ